MAYFPEIIEKSNLMIFSGFRFNFLGLVYILKPK